MKKRILGLALALVMIISLLPLTALAADPMPKLTVYSNGSSVHSAGMSGATYTVWFTPVDIHQDDDPAKPVIGNKLVKVTAAPYPTTNFIKFAWVKSTNLVTITFNNVNYKPTVANDTFFVLGANSAGGVDYTNAYDILINLEGANNFDFLTTKRNEINLNNNGKLTITGSGSLNIATYTASSGMINKVKGGELIIKDTTVTMSNSNDYWGTAMIVNNGPVVIDNSNVTLYTGISRGIVTSSKFNTDPSNTDYGITVKNNSTLLIDGYYDEAGTLVKRSSANLLRTAGTIRFENSNVELHKGESERSPVTSVTPEIVGTYSEKKYKEQDAHSWSNYTGLGLEVGAAIPTSENFRHFKLVHKHEFVATANDCTAAKACACGATQEATGTHAGVVTDCTKDTMCTNPGCQQVYAAAKGTAHEANTDDGDCTTAVTCKHCTTVVTAAKEKHADSRTDCAVAGTCTNAGCTHAFAAGQHNPAADDGNCTTDIKCATCGKVAKAGEAAHKYTDKKDTTCNNAGCTNTRTVEGTENPKTGDNTALVLMVALMATAAAAFVTTKKFAR